MRTSLHCIHCVFEVAATPIYLSLTLTAWAALLFPCLRDLATHGKTRESSIVERQSNQGSLDGTAHGFLDNLLHGEKFMVQKRNFLHFYIAGIISITSCLLLSAMNASDARFAQKYSFADQVSILLLLIHLLRRCYECLFVHQWSQKGKMHIAGYFLGIIHYIVLGSVFVPQKGEFCGRKNLITSATTFDMQRLLGIPLCLAAQYEQYCHHCILANLRRESDKAEDNSTGNYHMPVKRGFQFVSCPHYFAEIIIYLAFLILLGPLDMTGDPHNHNWNRSVDGLTLENAFNQLLLLWHYRHTALFIWVSSNLIILALSCHEWYASKFRNYDRSKRKAIFPFIL